jgi:hypothetical protein
MLLSSIPKSESKAKHQRMLFWPIVCVTCHLFSNSFFKKCMHHLLGNTFSEQYYASLITCLALHTLNNLCVTCHLFSDAFFKQYYASLVNCLVAHSLNNVCITFHLFSDAFFEQFMCNLLLVW